MTITHDKFPKQGPLLGTKVIVVFDYDTAHQFDATCIRDDDEDPCRTLFQLADGRVVLATECQYRPVE